MNEAEYIMKNYGDRGGCYPSRPYSYSHLDIQTSQGGSYMKYLPCKNDGPVECLG